MVCFECGREMRETDEPITEMVHGELITVAGILHWHCDACGDDWFSIDEADRLASLQLREVDG